MPDNNLRDIIIMPIFRNQGKNNPRLRRLGKCEKNHITNKTGKMKLKKKVPTVLPKLP